MVAQGHTLITRHPPTMLGPSNYKTDLEFLIASIHLIGDEGLVSVAGVSVVNQVILCFVLRQSANPNPAEVTGYV